MALAYPPVAAAFLALFDGATEASVVWENPGLGLFGLVVPPPAAAAFVVPLAPAVAHAAAAPVSVLPETIVEVDTDLVVPVIPPEERCTANGLTPLCHHGTPSVRRTVVRATPNHGRGYFTCASTEARRCGFFRWCEDADQFSHTRIGTPLTADEVLAETQRIDAHTQLDAWSGLRQGTPDWLRLRACRLTASNFGTVNRTNSFARPEDLLRSLLWPTSVDSVAMRYGSVNEKAALRRFAEYMSRHAARPDLPVYIDEPGIWVSSQYPFLGGSPDGVCYVCVDAHPLPDGTGVFYRCERWLIEIKTPYKLRNRAHGGEFYPMHRQRNGLRCAIPGAYFDQIQGNAWLIGLRGTYFVVLSPTGFGVTVVPQDAGYIAQQLLPALVDFWHNTVVPAFRQRDTLGGDGGVYFGWLPDEVLTADGGANKRKVAAVVTQDGLFDQATDAEPPAARQAR